MIIAVDFDGTLHMGAFPSIGMISPDARKYMQILKDEGHYIIINTCRCDKEQLAAINWLKEQDIPFDRVNDNHPENTVKYQSNSRKIYAHVYVDDKQVGGLPPWKDIYEYIKEEEAKYMESLRLGK
jgi:hypothetical protein